MNVLQIQYKSKNVRIFSSLKIPIADSDHDFAFVQSSTDLHHWQNSAEKDLVEIIKKGELSHLLGFICLRAFNKRFETQRKGNFLEDRATEDAVFIGRAPHIPLLRAWRKTKGREKATYLGWLLGSVIRPPLRDFQARLDGPDLATNAKHQLSKLETMPTVKKVFIDETVEYLALKIDEAAEEDIEVLVHHSFAQPLYDKLEETETKQSAEDLLSIPDQTTFSKILPWIITAIILIAFVLGCVFMDFDKMKDIVLIWIVANSSLAALGTALAGGHILTVICTAISAPFVSLNPAVGAGMVGSLVQAIVRPPSVEDIENIGEELVHISGWWKNKLARLLLIFVAANLFSSIGSFVALLSF